MTSSADQPGRNGAEFVVFMGLMLAFVAATFLIGWWGVPLVALVWGVWGPSASSQQRLGLLAAASAASAWVALLTWTASRGPLALLATTLGEVFRVPGAVLFAVTLAFVGLLAWSAARVGAWARAQRG